MNIFLIIFLSLFGLFFIFGTVRVNGAKTNNLWYKIVASVIFAIILGLPVLGIISLLG